MLSLIINLVSTTCGSGWDLPFANWRLAEKQSQIGNRQLAIEFTHPLPQVGLTI